MPKNNISENKRYFQKQLDEWTNTLSEKDKRRYAAIEAMKLGHGGIAYIAQLLNCDPQTINQGIKDLESLPIESEYNKRIRQPGGG